MMAALKRMRTRNRGAIVNVGSALTYRSVPLQSIYCGAKAAIRGFTDSLRSEIIHDKLDIHICMVDLPAVNTPQFNWAVNKLGLMASPCRRSISPRCRPAPSVRRHPPPPRDLGRLAHRAGHLGQPHRPGLRRRALNSG